MCASCKATCQSILDTFPYRACGMALDLDDHQHVLQHCGRHPHVCLLVALQNRMRSIAELLQCRSVSMTKGVMEEGALG
jgi:hypothetical protein